MVYVLTVEFDPNTPELTPEPEEVAERVRVEMNAEFGELGYRATTVFCEPEARAILARSRSAAGIR